MSGQQKWHSKSKAKRSTRSTMCISLHWIFVSLIFHIYFSQFVEHELKLDLIVVNHIHFCKSGCDTEKLLMKSDDVHDTNTHKKQSLQMACLKTTTKNSAQTFIWIINNAIEFCLMTIDGPNIEICVTDATIHTVHHALDNRSAHKQMHKCDVKKNYKTIKINDIK